MHLGLDFPSLLMQSLLDFSKRGPLVHCCALSHGCLKGLYSELPGCQFPLDISTQVLPALSQVKIKGPSYKPESDQAKQPVIFVIWNINRVVLFTQLDLQLHTDKEKEKVLVAQLCLTLWDPVDCIPPGSSIHGISQARIPEWVVVSFQGIFPTQGSNPGLLRIDKQGLKRWISKWTMVSIYLQIYSWFDLLERKPGWVSGKPSQTSDGIWGRPFGSFSTQIRTCRSGLSIQ